MTRRQAVLLLLDLAVWALAVWLLTAPPGQPLAPRAWHQAATTCRWVAHRFGIWAIEAERHYWKAVRT